MTKLLATVAALALLAAPAHAQSKRELADADARLAGRIDVLEQRFLTGDPAAQRLMQRVDQLDTTVRALTGDVERLTYEREQLRGELQALAGDLRAMQELETRMRIHLDAVDIVAAEAAAAGASPLPIPSMVGAVGGPANLPATPQAPLFREIEIPAQAVAIEVAALPLAGRQKLTQGDFDGARADFQSYLAAAPGAQDEAEVRYWLGETHYVRDEFAQAAQSYIASMKANREGPKAADAMVRLGASLGSLGKTEQACQTLRQLESEYPSASASVREKARVARSRAGC